MRYAIKNKTNGEYLRKGYETADAFTDDLGHAALFNSVHFAQYELEPGEIIVGIEEDADGGLYEVLPQAIDSTAHAQADTDPLPFEPTKAELEEEPV